MARIIVRSAESGKPPRSSSPMGYVAAGLALGAALGTFLAEMLAPAAQRATRRLGRGAAPSVAELVHDAQAVLDADVQLRDFGVEVIPVGRGAIELHGWVDTRKARTRAATLVAQGVDAESVVNCILVHGEDDIPPMPADDADALQA